MKQHGLSLIELMVAILIGTILMAGFLNVYLGQRANYMMQEGVSRVQENARIAQYLLDQDLRMSGMIGCNRIENASATNNISAPSSKQTLTSSDFIRSYAGSGGTWSPSIPASITNNLAAGTSIKANTDVITIKRVDNTTVGLSSSMLSSAADIVVPNQITFAPNDTLFITDCESTDIFTATAGTTSTLIKHSAASNLSANLNKAYQTDASVGKLLVYTYYIRSSGRTNSRGNDIPVLVRQDAAGTEIELAEGVENMKLTFGVDTNGDHTADTYSTADTVNAGSQWDKIVSVRITSLFNSVEETSPTPQRYVFQGATVTPTDRLYRKQWESYITLRNRTI